jgi:hypothetical protein
VDFSDKNSHSLTILKLIFYCFQIFTKSNAAVKLTDKLLEWLNNCLDILLNEIVGIINNFSTLGDFILGHCWSIEFRKRYRLNFIDYDLVGLLN